MESLLKNGLFHGKLRRLKKKLAQHFWNYSNKNCHQALNTNSGWPTKCNEDLVTSRLVALKIGDHKLFTSIQRTLQQQILSSRKHRTHFDRTGNRFAPAIVRVQNAFGRAGINNCRCGE